MQPWTPARYWEAIHTERARLLTDLEGLTEAQWSTPSLCHRWTVEDVVAHLTAAATTGRWAWLRSIVGARLDPAVHNDRRLAERRGRTPAQTLEAFRAVVTARTAPTGDLWAWLGEVVVHATDIREPLGISSVPATAAVAAVAQGYAGKNFAVESRTVARDLRLVAHDSEFRAGAGPTVEGTTLDLVLAMAGRPSAAARLTGDGAPTLVARVAAAAPGASGAR